MVPDFATMIATRLFAQHTFKLGDIEFLCQCDPTLSERQFTYVENYIPAGGASTSLGRFHMRTVMDDALFHTASQHLVTRKTDSLIEFCAGVVYAVYVSPEGTWFRPCQDAQDDSVGEYLVYKRREEVDILLHHASRHPERYLLRAMREIMLRCYENAHGSLFHAAGVTLNQHGLMFCGRSSAGKTTVMTLCLQTLGAQLLANDRLIFMRTPTPQLIAVPMSVRVGLGTLSQIPPLQAFLVAHQLSRPQITRPLPGKATDFGSVKKIEFSPAEYTEAIGTSFTQCTPLTAIIFPKLTDDETAVWSRTLPPPQAAERLKEICFTPHDETWLQPWLIERLATNDELVCRSTATCEFLARSYPSIEIGFGVRQPWHEITRRVAESIGGFLV